MMTVLARLGRDVEVRFLDDGKAVANLSLCYNYGRKAEGEKYRPSQWIETALWGKQAEALAPFLKKGGRVLAHISDVHIEEYEDKGGEKKIKLTGWIAGIELAGSPGEKAEAPKPKPEPKPAPFDDDIPF